MHIWLLRLIIAAGEGIVVSVFDLIFGRKKALYWPATLPCCASLMFDAVAAAIVLGPTALFANRISSNPFWWPAVLAGLAGPLFMRITVSFTARGRPISLNALGMLRRLQVKANRQIDEACAVGESNWISDKVMPAILALSLEEVVSWSVQALAALDRSGAELRDRDDAIQNIKIAAADVHAAVEERMRLIVQIMQDSGGHKIVCGLMRRSPYAAVQNSVIGFDAKGSLGMGDLQIPKPRESNTETGQESEVTGEGSEEEPGV